MSWILQPVVLTGTKVKLIPLQQAHFAALTAIAAHKSIWEYMGFDGTDKDRVLLHLYSSLIACKSNLQYPFTIIDTKTNEVIGSTMFHNIYPENRKLEIGWTWLHPDYWRSGHNRECKLLLLTYCFETLNTLRVQFQANEQNKRSCNAIVGIGAQFEGIIRNDRIRENGQLRNTALFSIIDSEWKDIKKKLI